MLKLDSDLELEPYSENLASQVKIVAKGTELRRFCSFSSAVVLLTLLATCNSNLTRKTSEAAPGRCLTTQLV